jgi:hypothetical protein
MSEERGRKRRCKMQVAGYRAKNIEGFSHGHTIKDFYHEVHEGHEER